MKVRRLVVVDEFERSSGLCHSETDERHYKDSTKHKRISLKSIKGFFESEERFLEIHFSFSRTVVRFVQKSLFK